MTSKRIVIQTVLGATDDGSPTVVFNVVEETLAGERVIGTRALPGELAPRLLNKAIGVILEELLPSPQQSNLIVATGGLVN